MIKITAQNDATIKFKGTNVSLTSCVLRLDFWGEPSGKKIQIALIPYESETAFNSGSAPIQIEGRGEIEEQTDENDVVTQVFVEGFTTAAKYYSLEKGTDPETYDQQSLSTAETKVSDWLTALGYVVEII